MSQITLRSGGRPLDSREFRRPGSKELLFGANGKEITASNNKDALQGLLLLADAINRGEVVMDSETRQEKTLTAAEERELVVNSYHKGTHSPEWKKIGTMLAYEVRQYSERQGFFRNFLAPVQVAPGSKPEITVTQNNVAAVVAVGPSQLQPQYIWDEVTFTPPEFDIKVHVRVFEKDLRNSSVDLLDRRYNDALESIQAQEDRTFKMMMDDIAGTGDIPLVRFGNSLSPANIAYMRQLLEAESVNPVNVLMDSSYMTDFINNASFTAIYDPVTQREVLMTGRIFSGLYGLNWFTDTYRKRRNLKVLNRGDFYMMAEPSMLGSYGETSPLQAIPTDGYNQGEDSRGWYIKESLFIALHSPRNLVKGMR